MKLSCEPSADWRTEAIRFLSQPLLICLLLALVTIAVFLPVAHFDFLNYDDPDYFSANPRVESGLSWQNFIWAFNTNAAANWHPLTWLSLMLDADLFGTNPAGPHLINLLFHAANVVLIFLLLRQVTKATWRSAIVAALFALHPLHVESVAWISERKDVLSTFFGLLTLLAYTRFVATTESFNSKNFYILSLGLFALGLMSKPMLVTLPFAMLLLDFWPLQRFRKLPVRKLFLEKIPFFVLSAAASIVTFLVQKNGGAVKTQVPFLLRLENVFISYACYLKKIFWPEPLATPYPLPQHLDLPPVIFAAVLTIGISAAAIFSARRLPSFFTGWFWFVGMLVPVIGLIQVGDAAMADRYTYLPLIGFFIAVVWLAEKIILRCCVTRWFPAILSVIVISFCAAKTRGQLQFWQNSGTLFQHALAVTKNNYVACNNLGTWLEANGNTSEATNWFSEALRIKPDNTDAMFNLGNAFVRLRDWDAAIAQYRRALQINPMQADVLNNLGLARAAQKNFPGAIEDYNAALKLNPDSADTHNNLAAAYFQQGKFNLAAEHFYDAVKLAPGNLQFCVNLAGTLLRLGNTNGAAQFYRQALQLQPDDEATRQKLQMFQP